MAAVVVLPPSGTKTAAAEQEHMDIDAHTQTGPAAEEDLYTRLKTLQRQLEFIEIQVGAWLQEPADSSSSSTGCACGVFVKTVSLDKQPKRALMSSRLDTVRPLRLS